MSVVCIIYDFHAPGQKYAKMDEAIKALKLDGGKPFNTTWFLSTTMTPEQVYDKISHVADENDKLITFVATSPAKWKGLNQNWTVWLKASL